VIAKLELSHEGFFPFQFDPDDDTGLMFNILRSFENLDIINDKFGYYLVVEPMDTNGFHFYLANRWKSVKFRFRLMTQFYKHIFSIKTQKNRKEEGFAYYNTKKHNKLNKVSLYMVCQ